MPVRGKVGRPRMDARRRGGSGAETGGPEQAFEIGVWYRHLVQPTRRRRSQGWEALRGGDKEGRRRTDVVTQHVLHGRFRIIQVEGTILVVMVALFLPVQCGVFRVGQRIHRRADARERHRLPQHGK
jgi:hypothetical protein